MSDRQRRYEDALAAYEQRQVDAWRRQREALLAQQPAEVPAEARLTLADLEHGICAVASYASVRPGRVVLAARRPRPRTHAPRRRRGASGGRRSRAPGEPSRPAADPDLARPLKGRA